MLELNELNTTLNSGVLCIQDFAKRGQLPLCNGKQPGTFRSGFFGISSTCAQTNIVCAQCTLLVLYNGWDFHIKGSFSQCHVINVTQEQYCLVGETGYKPGEHQRLSTSHWLIFITIQHGVHLYRRAVQAHSLNKYWL